MSKLFETIKICRLCWSKRLIDILDLGDQPPANSLYKVNEERPFPVPLRLIYCEDCSTVQLGESIDPEYLFGEYLWVTGTSLAAEQHSHQFAKEALCRCFRKKPSVVEIASNDGTFLKRFLEVGCSVLGVDPARNIAKAASINGIPTLAEFFTEDLAKRLVKEKGLNDIVFARNVLPHVKEIHSVVKGLRTLLKEDGLAIIEFHDAGLILEKLHYDSIYHEHLFLFSVKTISKLLEKHDLHVFDIVNSPISGGSWIIYISNRPRPKSRPLLNVIKKEKENSINTYRRWEEFAEQAELHSNDLKDLVLGNNGKMLAYGASARSSTLLNYCGLNFNHIYAIIDKNPMKQGLMTPGSDIPIISFEQGVKEIKDVDKILLLAWNLENEIVNEMKLAGFTGQFIVPLPNKPHLV